MTRTHAAFAAALIIAAAGLAGAQPRPRRSPPEHIDIHTPTFNAEIRNPVWITGVGSATQHNELDVRVRDENGRVIGQGTVRVQGGLGSRGAFSGTVRYRLRGARQRGRLEVFDVSPRDGQITHLSSVDVRLTPTPR